VILSCIVGMFLSSYMIDIYFIFVRCPINLRSGLIAKNSETQFLGNPDLI